MAKKNDPYLTIVVIAVAFIGGIVVLGGGKGDGLNQFVSGFFDKINKIFNVDAYDWFNTLTTKFYMSVGNAQSALMGKQGGTIATGTQVGGGSLNQGSFNDAYNEGVMAAMGLGTNGATKFGDPAFDDAYNQGVLDAMDANGGGGS